MKDTQRLIIKVHHVPEEGERLQGRLASTALDLPEERNRFETGGTVDYDLRVSRVGGGLLVAGSVGTRLRCRCDRCLRYDDLDLRNDEVCHYYERLAEDLLDVTDDVREDLLINLPQKFICAPGCAGLCPSCGQNLNVGPCECVAEAAGAEVWDKLDGLEL